MFNTKSFFNTLCQAQRQDSVTGGAEINFGWHEKFILCEFDGAREHEKFIPV